MKKLVNLVLVLILGAFISTNVYGQQNNLDQRLIGKWGVLSKSETESVKGVQRSMEEDTYTPGEKTYEFSADNKITITEVEGQETETETKPAWMENGKLYIGKKKRNKAPYTIEYSGDNKITLTKEEQDRDDGEIVTEVEKVVLERL